MGDDQQDLFGGPSRAMHRVAAHSRVLADGTSVFVQEHLRWNRPAGARRRAPSQRQAPDETVPENQLPLW